MDIGQGSDIPIRIDLEPVPGDASQLTDFADLTNIIVYAYTDWHIVKFSMVPKEGYETLTPVGSTTLVGVIPGSSSALMRGALKLDTLVQQAIPGAVAPDDLVEDIVLPTRYAGINIKYAPIKIETDGN